MAKNKKEFNDLVERIRTNTLTKDDSIGGVLNLRFQELTRTDVKKLAQALKHNQTLTSLYLRRDKITTQGVKHLEKALEHNKTLTSLYFLDNGTITTRAWIARIDLDRALFARINGYLERNRRLAEQRKQALKSPPKQAPKNPNTFSPIPAEMAGLMARVNALEQTALTYTDPAPLQATLLNMEQTDIAKALSLRIQGLQEQVRTLQKQQKEHSTPELAERLGQLDTEVQRLEKEKANKNVVDELIAQHVELQKLYSLLLKENSEDLEALGRNLKALYSETGNAIDTNQMLKDLAELRSLMQSQAVELAELARSKKDHSVTDQQLANVITDPQAHSYAYNLTAGLNQLYAVGMLLQTDYFEAEGEKGRKAKAIISGIGKLLPVGSNYVDIVANIVSEVSKKKNQEAFGHLIAVAAGPSKMDQLAHDLMRELALSNPGKLNKALCSTHLKNISKALFAGKLKEFTQSKEKFINPKKYQEQLIGALANVAERKPVHAIRHGQAQSLVAQPAKSEAKSKKHPQGVVKGLDSEDVRMLKKVAHTKKVEEARVKAKLKRFEAEKKNIGGKLIKELKGKITSPVGIVFMEPKDDKERNLQNRVNARLSDLYDDLFDKVNISKSDKRSLKTCLRAAIVDKVLRDRATKDVRFQTAFLKGDINQVYDTLVAVLNSKLNSPEFVTVDNAFVRTVVEHLALGLVLEQQTVAPAPQPNQRRSNRRRSSAWS